MQRFAFLEGSDLVEKLPPSRPEGMDMLICLDTGTWKRLGSEANAVFEGTPCVVNIDHHATNSRYGHVNLVVDDAAACGFVLYNLFQELGWEITPAIAAALYTAISTDTGSFHYHETTPAVMRAVASLMEAGADVMEINGHLYDEESPERIIVRREVLNKMVLEPGGEIVHYSMEAGTKERLGVGLEATKDLVDDIRTIRGVKVAVIFEDLENGVIRASLRSKTLAVDVAKIASMFGGGGHALASGIRMHGELAACREAVLNAIREAVRHE